MRRGFLAGIFWGAIVGVALLLVSTQTLERQQLSFPRPEASPVEVPAGTEFDQARAETDPVVPEPESRPDAEAVTGVALPEDAVETPPSFDTSALEMPAPDVTAPGGLGDAPAPGDGAPTAPAAADGTVAGNDASRLEAPEAPGAAPATETVGPSTAVAPESAGGQAPELTEETGVNAAVIAALPETAPETPAPEASLPAPVTSDVTPPEAMSAPEISAEPSLPTGADSGPAAPSLPQITEEPSLPSGTTPAPEVADESPVTPQAPAADGTGEPDAAAQIAPATGGAGVVTVDGAASSFFEPVESLTDHASGVETDRLPRIGDEPAAVEAAEGAADPGSEEDPTETAALPNIIRPADQETEQAAGAGVLEAGTDKNDALPTILRPGETQEVTESGAATDENDEEPDTGGPAIARFSVAFENPAGHPLVAIVLVQEGSAELSAAELEGLPKSIAFGIEAGAPDAARSAAFYRAAGREVVMIPSLPEGARPQDVEQALRVNFQTIPEAVAVMDASGGSFQSDRAAVSQIVEVVAATGHGLITYPKGFNTAHQQAERAGVPNGLIFRRIDGEGETMEQIERTLDRAAFRARQDEAVILVGSTHPETLAAVVEWALGSRAESVTIAPVSAALGGG